MTVCKNGLNKMHQVIPEAVEDIRSRLWTLYWLARLLPGHTLVECGVRRGDSTRALLAACEDSGKQLWSFDIEDTRDLVLSRSGASADLYRGIWHFFRCDSVTAAHCWGGTEMPGMVFVDTNHEYETTRAEIAAWAPQLLPGGCLAFHDYWLKADNPDDHRDGVKPAVDEWANGHPDDWKLETHDATSGDTGFALLWKKE